MKKNLIVLLTILLLPINIFAYSNYIIPGGNNIGIEVQNNGIIVIGFYKINNKFNTTELKIGDTITHINNNRIYRVDEMIKEIENNVVDNKVNVTILRNKKELTVEVTTITMDLSNSEKCKRLYEEVKKLKQICNLYKVNVDESNLPSNSITILLFSLIKLICIIYSPKYYSTTKMSINPVISKISIIESHTFITFIDPNLFIFF